ncbi:unnamed protein product, partial [Bubo scandiacus]
PAAAGPTPRSLRRDRTAEKGGQGGHPSPARLPEGQPTKHGRRPPTPGGSRGHAAVTQPGSVKKPEEPPPSGGRTG